MANPKPPGRRGWLASLAFHLGLGMALLLAGRSVLVSLPETPALQRLYGREDPGLWLSLRQKWEKVARRLPARGNLFVEFRLAPEDFTAASAYFTWTYLLYPRRVYVGSEPRVINSARDLAAPAARPSPAWMRDHHLAALLLVRRDAGGRLSIRAEDPARERR